MESSRDYGTPEEVWSIRNQVYQAASTNPSFRNSPPRLEEMDSLDSVEFVAALEGLCGITISENEVCNIFGEDKKNIGISGFGKIADYILGKKCGERNG